MNRQKERKINQKKDRWINRKLDRDGEDRGGDRRGGCKVELLVTDDSRSSRSTTKILKKF